MMTDLNIPLYGAEPLPHAMIFAGIFFLGFIASFWFIKKSDNGDTRAQTISQILLFLWVVGPPVWFFLEYFFYFPAYGNPAAGFERLKSAQDVTAKIWAAFAVVLGALYNKKFPGDSAKD